MSEVILTGIASNIAGEERALAHLQVTHNGNTYEWQAFVPAGTENLTAFVDSIKSAILADIDAKESAWSQLEPKTRTVTDPITGNNVEVPIAKEEVVKPSIPDYYAMRRSEYPSLGDQLDALWKGSDSTAFADMVARIAAIKVKYPKP